MQKKAQFYIFSVGLIYCGSRNVITRGISCKTTFGSILVFTGHHFNKTSGLEVFLNAVIQGGVSEPICCYNT